MKRASHEKYEIITVHRRELKNAPYNPRQISDEARKRLKKGIAKFGLVEPPVWNRRTGHIVSGHQRISILDELEGTDDYYIHVAVVDVDEKTEKKLNVQLNNPQMQGEFDLERLGDLVLEVGPDDLGFSETDIAVLFDGDERFLEMFGEGEDVQRAKDTLRDIKKNREEMMKKYAEEQSASFYFVVVCESAEEKAQILREMGVSEYEEFIHSKALNRLRGEYRGGEAAGQKQTDA